MTVKRVTYLPMVQELADLPSASAFEVGVGFWVQETQKIYYSNGVSWVLSVGVQGAAGLSVRALL